MAASNKFTTMVFQLPADKAVSAKFLDGVAALAKEHSATKIAGSVHDEMSYLEILEKELADQIGQMGVEDIRKQFERDQRAKD